MSRWTLTVLVVIGMAGTARAAQAQPAALLASTNQDQPTVVLHVMNYAALSREVLDATMARVARVYKRHRCAHHVGRERTQWR